MAAERRDPQPARRAILNICGKHLRGCGIGRPEEDDASAIQRMVDLRDADPSLSERAAAARAAVGLKGNPKTHIERLRRKYRKLRNSNALPRGGDVARVERKIERMRTLFQERQTTAEEARRKLVEREAQAQALGIDLNQDLTALVMNLEGAREHLTELINTPAEWSMSAFFGVEPEKAMDYVRQAPENLRIVQEKIDLVREIRRLRGLT